MLLSELLSIEMTQAMLTRTDIDPLPRNFPLQCCQTNHSHDDDAEASFKQRDTSLERQQTLTEFPRVINIRSYPSHSSQEERKKKNGSFGC